MKPFISFLLMLALISFGCRFSLPTPSSPAGKTPSASTVKPSSIDWDDRSVFQGGLVESAQPVLQDFRSATVYRIQLKIDTDLVHVQGHEELRYTNAEDVPLADLRLRLFPNLLGGDMHVPEVQVDGQPVTPSYSLSDSLLTVPLASPLQPGESVILGMDFTLAVPESVDLNYGVLAYVEGVLALAHAYPMIPVYNEEGWNAEVPPQYGDLTFADMSFFIVEITAPEDVQLVAVGREISRQEVNSNQVVTYAAGPVRDFYLTASADYRLVTARVGETTVNFYAEPSGRGGARTSLEFATRAIEVFGERYAPYPYTELDLVTTPTQALGIEYPGMIAITSWLLEAQNDYLEATVVHEVGHQWFYNLVGTDQLDQPWLDESLTQFATLQYFSDEYGTAGYQGFRSSLDSRWQRVDRAPIPVGLPVSGYTAEEYGAIIYGRGGLFFDDLRQEMGEEAFDSFLQAYTGTYSWQIANSEGMKTLAEKECSCDLSSLFEEWVYP